MKMRLLIFCFISSFLSAASLKNEMPLFSQPLISLTSDRALRQAAALAICGLEKRKEKNKLEINHELTYEDRRATALFVRQIIDEDIQSKRQKSRLQDPFFLQKHFKWLRWYPDKDAALKKRNHFPPGVKKRLNQEILLTKYTVFQVYGSYKKTEKYFYPLYQYDGDLITPSLTKQKILDGALNNQKEYQPLVWVTRQGLEKSLMQGTVIVLMPDNKKRYFHVHRHNGFLYDPKIRPCDQKRYWFFKEISGPNNIDTSSALAILKTENATCAGDIEAFGRGAFLCLKCKNKKEKYLFGFLNDTGGMFRNNQYQLDLFVGVSKNDAHFKKKISQIPETVEAYFLCKKRFNTERRNR